MRQSIRTMSSATFKYQKSLPRLPLPKLEETLQKYLITAKPYLTDKEYEITKKQVNDAINDKEMKRRQDKLEQRVKEKENWLEEYWFKIAYWSWRAPLCINSNVVGYLLNDNKLKLPQGYSAAAITIGLLKYHIGLLEGTILPDMNRDKPQCMDQYTRMFSLNRIPGKEVDDLIKYNENESKHIIVSCGNRFYKINVLQGKDGREMIPLEKLNNQMNWIINDYNKKGINKYPIGVLTSTERTFWANARERLIKSSKVNEESLKEIESALFVVCLEDKIDTTDTETARTALHGDGRTRWFDKSFNIVVTKDGNPSILVEHSWADAPVPLAGFFNHALPYVEKLTNGGGSISSGKDLKSVGEAITLSLNGDNKLSLSSLSSSNDIPIEIKFDINNETEKDIVTAEKEVDAMIKDSDTQVKLCAGLGKPVWKQAKISPDAAVQMAMQLAWRRLHGGDKPISTYETIGMVPYLKGRTEACRVVSNESENFVKTMMSGYLRNKTKENAKIAEIALRQACDSHVKYILSGQQGKGIDRHMLGLRLMSEDGKQPDIFKDEIFGRTGGTGGWILSTSNNSYIPRPFGGMFGTVMPNGYGVCYIPMDEGVLLCVESKHSCPQTSSESFIAMTNECLMDIATIAGVNIPRSML